MCGKAKEAGKCPSYTGLVLTFVHNYNIDNINKPAPGVERIFYRQLDTDPLILNNQRPHYCCMLQSGSLFQAQLAESGLRRPLPRQARSGQSPPLTLSMFKSQLG